MITERHTYNIASTRARCQGLSPWYKEQKAYWGWGVNLCQVGLIRAIKTYWGTQDTDTSFSQGNRGRKPYETAKKPQGNER